MADMGEGREDRGAGDERDGEVAEGDVEESARHVGDGAGVARVTDDNAEAEREAEEKLAEDVAPEQRIGEAGEVRRQVVDPSVDSSREEAGDDGEKSDDEGEKRHEERADFFNAVAN